MKEKYLDGVRVEKDGPGYFVRKGNGFGEVGFGLTPKKAKDLVRMLVEAGVPLPLKARRFITAARLVHMYDHCGKKKCQCHRLFRNASKMLGYGPTTRAPIRTLWRKP